MTINFLPQLADAEEFPAPQILALPVKSRIVTVPELPWSCFEAQRLVYDHARSALFHVASVLGGGKNWLPAYHCPALVEPFLAAGMPVAFFPVREDLEPDMEFLARHVSSGDAVTAIRYFGFECGIRNLAELCEERGCVLIEDLAHAPFVPRIYGDLAVTSLAKFYPIKSGGELCFPITSAYKKFLEELHGSLPGRAKEFAKKVLRKAKIGGQEHESRPSYRYFSLPRVSRNIRRVDELLLKRQTVGPLVAKRRSNYGYFADSLCAASTGKPLFPELPRDVAPYVFPFLLESESGFTRLRRRRIQIYRWEEMARSHCEVSQAYRHRLVQLPCHQDLSQEQLSEIVDVLR